MNRAEPTLPETSTEDAPIARFIHHVLSEAITRDASDLHFEPYEHHYRIRFRQDGILRELPSPPAPLISRIAARLKVMARLDISEKRLPQDGRFRLTLPQKRSMEFRVSTCPTVFGEKIVLRLLDPKAPCLALADLGYENDQLAQVLEGLCKTEGMILVTGPTGSGKTVSLYTAVNHLNTPEVNICTVEDPIEVHIPGITQVQINPKAGLSFAHTLRAFLRQDPDILMVGEIRDLETAEIALKAAQTGHLVLSTLHTNSALETLTRLVQMGIPTFQVATCVHLIISQRLVRSLCPFCKQAYTLSKAHLCDLGFQSDAPLPTTFFKPTGCTHCYQGYKGRTALFEILALEPKLQDYILNGSHLAELKHFVKASGMRSLRQSGFLKAPCRNNKPSGSIAC